MEKLKNLNLTKIIIIYILIQPILDVITSLCIEYINPNLTFGILVRTIFMGVIVLYSLFKLDKSNKIKNLIYYALVGIYMCIFLITLYNQNGTNMIFSQIKSLIRAYYFPIVLVALYGLCNNTIKIDNKYFIWALLEYCVVIFISKIAGIAYPTYKYGLNLGTVGLFYSANEIGAIISILSPLLFIELIRDKKFNIVNVITLILLIFSVLEIGTKVPLLSFVMTYALSLIICIIKTITQKEKRNYIIKIISAIFISVIIVFTIGYTPVGKNLETNYGIKFVTFNKISESPNSTPENTLPDSDEQLDINVTDIVSGRNELLKINLEKYMNSSTIEKIFGNGYLISTPTELKVNKLVEIDYFDLFFSHGIIGIIIWFIPLIYILIKSIVITLKHFVQILKDEEMLLYWYSICLGFGITLLAGHVLSAPAVSIFMILTILNLNKCLEGIQ